jgi:integrase/recombinase XerD
MLLYTSATEEFLTYCKFEKHLSEKTVKAYETDLLQFREYVTKILTTEDVASITKNELRAYLASLVHFKHKTIKRKIASLKALFNYLEFEDKIIINPFRKVRINIREPKRLPKVMDMREINRVFKCTYAPMSEISAAGESSRFTTMRNIVIIELLFNTGARVSEIANLKKEDINIDTGMLLIRGKGNKERVIQLCNKECLESVRKYYRNYCKLIENAEGHFLINRLGNKLSDQSIRGIVKNLTQRAGIDRHITPHVFRHSFATLLLERDVDIIYIKSLLGHSSIATTQIYTHVNRAKQKQILKTKHPRKDLSMLSVSTE